MFLRKISLKIIILYPPANSSQPTAVISNIATDISRNNICVLLSVECTAENLADKLTRHEANWAPKIREVSDFEKTLSKFMKIF